MKTARRTTIARLVVGAGALAVALLVLPPATGAERAPAVTNGTVRSADGTVIAFTQFRPSGADGRHPAPMVLHSHGWGGSRTTSAESFASWLDAGFGVLSFDQRGFGESGGEANIEDPDHEGQDVIAVVDHVARLPWVAKEGMTPDGRPDPLLAAIGGSYGGGYQFVGAFTELRDLGYTRFDALAPEITWWDLRESLAPQGVPRSLWASLLYAAGATAVPQIVHESFAYSAATGQWPDGTLMGERSEAVPNLHSFLANNGPAWHVAKGRRLDIPVLFGQGLPDNLFNLNQALKNFTRALTPAARRRSLLVGYNGGHTLPSAMPPSTFTLGDPCSAALTRGGGFADLARRFFTDVFAGRPGRRTGETPYNLATVGGECLRLKALDTHRSFPIDMAISTAGPGGPINYELAPGPITVAGTPYLRASMTSVGIDVRAFFALSVGTTPADAQIVHANMLPVAERFPVSGERRTIELPAVAVRVPAGQKLFLTVSAFSDMSFGHGSRTPGVLQLENAVVRVPVVR